MAKVNTLSGVEIDRVGLCKAPAVEDAQFVLLKSKPQSDEQSFLEWLRGQFPILAKAEPTAKDDDMDLKNLTFEELSKARPDLVALAKEAHGEAAPTTLDEVEVKRIVDEEIDAKMAENNASIVEAVVAEVEKKLPKVNKAEMAAGEGEVTSTEDRLTMLEEAVTKLIALVQGKDTDDDEADAAAGAAAAAAEAEKTATATLGKSKVLKGQTETGAVKSVFTGVIKNLR